MPDLVYDGTRIWARVKWRLKDGGRTIDAAKTMMVDSGCPFTAISASNVAPELKIAGFVDRIHVAGCQSEGIILKGGEMSLTVAGRERTCAKPVVYSPCFRTDLMGADQIQQLELFTGLAVRPPPAATAPPPVAATPPPYDELALEEIIVTATRMPMGGGDAESWLIKWYLGMTLPPGMHPIDETPRPGLFAFARPPAPQGGYAAAAWRLEHRWPEAVVAGAPFELLVAFHPERDFDLVHLGFEPPHGFEVIEGAGGHALEAPRAGKSAAVAVRLVAPAEPGDHFWRTLVRTKAGGEEEATGVAGRIVVVEAPKALPKAPLA